MSLFLVNQKREHQMANNEEEISPKKRELRNYGVAELLLRAAEAKDDKGSTVPLIDILQFSKERLVSVSLVSAEELSITFETGEVFTLLYKSTEGLASAVKVANDTSTHHKKVIEQLLDIF